MIDDFIKETVVNNIAAVNLFLFLDNKELDVTDLQNDLLSIH